MQESEGKVKTRKYLCKVKGDVGREDWENINGHKAGVFWFTGLSGSGKSTIVHMVERELFERGVRVMAFDGDNIRHGICADLSFSREARAENGRRIAEIVKLFVQNGIVCLCAFISPMYEDRDRIRKIVGDTDYHEVFVSCPVEECERRDCKGYYKLAREGIIQEYTGISSKYEEPLQPSLLINSKEETLEKSVAKTIKFIADTIEA